MREVGRGSFGREVHSLRRKQNQWDKIPGGVETRDLGTRTGFLEGARARRGAGQTLCKPSSRTNRVKGIHMKTKERENEKREAAFTSNPGVTSQSVSANHDNSGHQMTTLAVWWHAKF